MKTILFPSSYFDIKSVDESLKYEYDTVVETGMFDVVLFSYDKFLNDGKLVLSNSVPKKCQAIYRGWMMKQNQYENFYNQLLQQNIELITNPYQYSLFHIFPNIYPKLEQDTAKMLIYSNEQKPNFKEIKSVFDKFIIKDFVKSVKGTDFPKYFENSITENEFEKYMQIFMKYRGDLYTGGICVKEYLSLKHYGTSTNEYRVFYANHHIVSIS